MPDWCLTTSPDNLARTAELGWTMQGLKSRRRRTAERLRAGDTITYYLTGAVAFGAVVQVTGPCFEDHDPVWTSNPGEDYPWRVPIRPDVVIANPQAWVPVVELRDRLEHVRKWPVEHWTLAFQGNIREWPAGDVAVVRAALLEAAG